MQHWKTLQTLHKMSRNFPLHCLRIWATLCWQSFQYVAWVISSDSFSFANSLLHDANQLLLCCNESMTTMEYRGYRTGHVFNHRSSVAIFREAFGSNKWQHCYRSESGVECGGFSQPRERETEREKECKRDGGLCDKYSVCISMSGGVSGGQGDRFQLVMRLLKRGNDRPEGTPLLLPIPRIPNNSQATQVRTLPLFCQYLFCSWSNKKDGHSQLRWGVGS